MPRYDYQYTDTEVEEVVEITQRITEGSLSVHPDNGRPIKRIVSQSGGTLYKGQGFHCTDYPNGGKP